MVVFNTNCEVCGKWVLQVTRPYCAEHLAQAPPPTTWEPTVPTAEDYPMASQVPPDDTKRCAGECGLVRPIEDFGKNSQANDGLQKMCRDCRSVYLKTWRAGQKEAAK